MSNNSGPVADPLRTETHRWKLYVEQEGRCAGCRDEVPFAKITADHIVPKVDGGGGYDAGNIQLMCADCNSAKGRGTQEEFEARLEVWNFQGRKCWHCRRSRMLKKLRLVEHEGRTVAVCKREKRCRSRVLGGRRLMYRIEDGKVSWRLSD